VPGARKAVIRNAAHVPNMERPEEFNRLVLEFLATHEPQP
jgi:pimeloyl-ACP methyl ester carboxylesterase